MSVTFAFDVYGTLIDPHGITELIGKHAGGEAAAFSRTWREKQLEYSFRRGLMGIYRDFSVATAQALDHTATLLGVSLSDAARSELLAAYRALPAFADTAPALKSLHAQGARMYAFSNGLPDDLAALLDHARIGALLAGVVSVHEVESFKPDPKVYHHFNDRTGSEPDKTWLVSSNPFDVIGARAVGWNAAWVRRTPAAVFDPWEYQPSVTVPTLAALVDLV